jgi:hypothetical protein
MIMGIHPSNWNSGGKGELVMEKVIPDVVRGSTQH